MSWLPRHPDRATRRFAIAQSRTHLACATLLLCFATSAIAANKIPEPNTHVADYAGVLDNGTEKQIDGYLTELEQKTGAQVIVLTVQTTEGRTIEQFALDVAEQWKLGQKGKDNGALVAVAIRERRARVEVGYGLEGVLPDIWCSRMQEQFFVPNFKDGNYARGLLDGAVAIANRIADEKGVKLSGVPATRVKARRGRRGTGASISTIIILIVIISIFTGGGRRRRYRRSWGGGLMDAVIIGSMLRGGGRSWGGGWGGGGGFGGGGFGGGSFGGGGGGGFGGGGASSGW